jgi:LAO/AO transport system kinase
MQASQTHAMKHRIDHLVQDVQAGNGRSTRAAAQLMTAMIDEPYRVAELLAGSDDWPQPRLVLGITGAPGSGKSTLVDHLATEWRAKHPERRLGIIAVDPSSPFTGGALLGDRVRMMRHANDPNVFIRSLATRGRLGGVALGVRGVIRVMGLAGCDVVLVETVGVGQSEVEIAQNADLVAVVLAPGQGDSIQMLKAGLMEAGDLFVINKADREGAAQLRQQLLASLALGEKSRVNCRAASPLPQPSPAVFSCSAVNHTGIRELLDAIEVRAANCTDEWRTRRERQIIDEVRQAVMETVVRRITQTLPDDSHEESRLRQILSGEVSLDSFVDRILQEMVAGEGRGTYQTLQGLQS